MPGPQTRSKSNSPASEGRELPGAQRPLKTIVRASPYPIASSSRTSPSSTHQEYSTQVWLQGVPLPQLAPAEVLNKGARRSRRTQQSPLEPGEIEYVDSQSSASKSPRPEARVVSPSPLPSSPPSSLASPSPSLPSSSLNSPIPPPSPSSQITRRVTRSTAGNGYTLKSLQDVLPSCSRRASPRSTTISPLQDEPEPLEWTQEVEKVKSILPHLPSNPQPWGTLDPRLVTYLALREEVRAGQEGSKGKPSKLSKSPSLVLTSLSPRLRRHYQADAH